MIELVFSIGGAIRRVFIDKKIITFLTAELNFEPLTIDLTKLDLEKDKLKKLNFSNEEMDELKELFLLNSEEAIAKDIIKDWQRKGWRCTRRNGLD